MLHQENALLRADHGCTSRKAMDGDLCPGGYRTEGASCGQADHDLLNCKVPVNKPLPLGGARQRRGVEEKVHGTVTDPSRSGHKDLVSLLCPKGADRKQLFHNTTPPHNRSGSGSVFCFFKRGSGLPSLKRETGDREEKDPLWQQVRIRCENASALSLKKLKIFLIYA